jgi:hypothetical protein
MGVKRYTSFDKATRLILYVAIVSFVIELIALYTEIKYRNNLPIYNIASVIYLLLLGLYFSKIITLFNTDAFRKLYSIAILLIWIATLFYEKSLFVLNSAFMIIVGIVVICFSILSIDNIVSVQSKRYFKLTTSIHFWFAVVFLFYWCITILQWGLYKYFSEKISGYEYINLALSLVSTLVNIAFGMLFYNYPKLKQADAS